MPAPMTSVMASRPSRVAGILIMTLGSAILSHSLWASSMVAWVSLAKSGETSMETRPSKPAVRS